MCPKKNLCFSRNTALFCFSSPNEGKLHQFYLNYHLANIHCSCVSAVPLYFAKAAEKLLGISKNSRKWANPSGISLGEAEIFFSKNEFLEVAYWEIFFTNDFSTWRKDQRSLDWECTVSARFSLEFSRVPSWNYYFENMLWVNQFTDFPSEQPDKDLPQRYFDRWIVSPSSLVRRQIVCGLETAASSITKKFSRTAWWISHQPEIKNDSAGFFSKYQ